MSSEEFVGARLNKLGGSDESRHSPRDAGGCSCHLMCVLNWDVKAGGAMVQEESAHSLCTLHVGLAFFPFI